jgi:hypothetical protein
MRVQNRLRVSALAAVAGLFVAGTSASLPGAVKPTAGAGPIATGDFNGDGKQDVVVIDGSGDGAMLLGNGDGTLQAPLSFNAGDSTQAVVVGDFNKDGKLDLAITASFSADLYVLLGNGNGTFQSPVPYGSAGALGIAVGDVNGDGNPDLVVANTNANTISVLLGNGDGTFQPEQTFPGAGAQPQAVVIGDFNGDGKPDLAFTDITTFTSGNVFVLLGNGDGTFQTARSYNTGRFPMFAVASDVNNDGALDLIVVNQLDNNVSVLLGNGDGTFQTAQNAGLKFGPSDLAVADFNGDGAADIAVLANAGISADTSVVNLAVELGDGAGDFLAFQRYDSGGLPGGMAVADLNGDGTPDLVLMIITNNSVSVLLCTKDGTFQAPQNYTGVTGS